MRTFTLSALIVVLLGACAPEEPGPDAQSEAAPAAPQSALEKAVAAMGGEQAIRNLSSLQIEATGRRWELDESPTPGGTDESPEPFSWTIRVDPGGQGMRMRIDATRTRPVGQHSSTQIIDGQLGVITGQDAQFGPPAQIAMTSDRQTAILKEQALLNPVVVLRGALENPDRVTQGPDEMMNGANHHVLIIDAEEEPITYYVNADSGLINHATHMELDFLRRDVEIEVAYDDWSLSSGGINFPRTVSLTLDGVRLLESTRSSIVANQPIDPALFEFPEGLNPVYDAQLAEFGADSHQVYQAMASLGFPRSGRQLEIAASELAPGVHHVTGTSHHSLVVEQDGGIVVVEAPLHDLRSEAVLAWIRSNLPGQPMTHAVATHHHTDHSAGLRTYAGAGADLVVHELAADFIADIMTRPSTLRPDRLAENPREVNIETMPADGSYTIPDSARPVTLYPLPNDHARDMVFVFVENAGVAFVSDIYNPNPNATEADAGARTLRAALEAAGVEPAIIAGGHGATIDGEAFAALFAE